MKITRRQDLIYPDLSYQIIGIAFKVFNDLRWGHKEIYYQRAYASALEKVKLKFKKERHVVICYKGKVIGRYKLDFVIEDKIVIEFKVRPRLGYIHIHQVLSYLKATNKKLAIIIYLTKDGVKYRRVINDK
jgi:GxxExxY protein